MRQFSFTEFDMQVIRDTLDHFERDVGERARLVRFRGMRGWEELLIRFSFGDVKISAEPFVCYLGQIKRKTHAEAIREYVNDQLSLLRGHRGNGRGFE